MVGEKRVVVSMLVFLFSLAFVLAQPPQKLGQGPPQDSSMQQSPDQMQGPPPEAIEACGGKSEGSSCSFSGMGGETVTGICGSNSGELACGPANGIGELESPTGGSSGVVNQLDQSSTQTARNTADIINEQTEEEPKGFFRRMFGFLFGWVGGGDDEDFEKAEQIIDEQKDVQDSEQGSPQEAIDACAGKSSGDSCSFSGMGGETIADSCNSDSGQLACGREPQSASSSESVSDITPTEVIATTYTSVDTGEVKCYDAQREITCPSKGDSFYGQDAQYDGLQMSYVDKGDGTVSDSNTGLMWSQNPGDKQEYYDAVGAVDDFELAGYDDWRVPTTKELYSLIDFTGEDVDPMASSADVPFIDDDVFGFEYGDTSTGNRIIDSQWVTSNIYVSKVMNNQECFFGLNFADGRIKCYPTSTMGNQGYFAIYVRGDSYGVNDFKDNGDETITDGLNDLMWQKGDSEEGLDWEDALSYCEDLVLADNSDWRLPNIKELQLIIDYTRSPDTTDSAALAGVFDISEITNEIGGKDYPYFWSGTTHANQMGGTQASFVSFGRAWGYFNGQWMDVHGAGSQKADLKFGDPDDYSEGYGPQGDAVRIYNYVRCVRG